MRVFVAVIVVIMISGSAKADPNDVYRVCYAKERAAKMDMEWAASEYKAGRAGYAFFKNAVIKAMEVTSTKSSDECIAEEKRKRNTQ